MAATEPSSVTSQAKASAVPPRASISSMISPQESASRLALVLGGLFALAGSGSSAAAVALPAVGAACDSPSPALVPAWMPLPFAMLAIDLDA